MCEDFKNSMMVEFDMSDLGRMRHFLGVEAIQSVDGILISQRRYAQEVLTRFGMKNSNAVKNPIVQGTLLSKDEAGEEVDNTLYKQLVGSLMYLTVTRCDLMYGMSLISRFIARPKLSHWLAAKRILRYLKGTTDFGAISWSSKKQPVVGVEEQGGFLIYCDNSSTIQLSRNHVKGMFVAILFVTTIVLLVTSGLSF
nr:retrovirus-related Pol polyprotein from transposon TNT 1-94 [Tanacetum cinerariifolium]